jgi:hypothetical protein
VSSAPEWRFIQFYIPLWFVFGYNFVLYAFLFTHLRALTLSRGADAAEVPPVRPCCGACAFACPRSTLCA